MPDLDPYSLTSQHAGEELARMTEAYRGPAPPTDKPTNAADAAARLNSLTADKAWGERLARGDIATTAEYRELTELAARGDHSPALTVEVVDSISDPHALSRSAFNGLVDAVREQGAPEDVIHAYLNGGKAPADLYRQVEQWKNARMRDAEWQKKFLANDAVAVKMMAVANMIVTAGPGEESK